MSSNTLSVRSPRGRLACFHEQLSGSTSLAHLPRPEQRARLAARLLAPFHRLPATDFELLLVDWVEAEPPPTVIDMCSLLAALLAIDAAEQASTVADLIAEAVDRGTSSKKGTVDSGVVWWAHCICERCAPLAKHLPEVQRKLQKGLADCDAILPTLS